MVEYVSNAELVKLPLSNAPRMSRCAKRELFRAMLTPVEKIGSTNLPVSHHYPAIANDLLHGVAVVALFLERPELRGLPQLGGHPRPAFRALPEELLARCTRLRKILALRYHSQARDPICDRDLPYPRIGDRQEIRTKMKSSCDSFLAQAQRS